MSKSFLRRLQRPARRLRHVTSIRLHNLYDHTADGEASYFYELRTWDSDRCAWMPFYRSEQLPTNSDLDWDRQYLDPESEISLRGLQHRPDVGPLCLRVYAKDSNSTAAAAAAATACLPHLQNNSRLQGSKGAAASACSATKRPTSEYSALPQGLPWSPHQEAKSLAVRSIGSGLRGQQTQPSPPLSLSTLPPAATSSGCHGGTAYGGGEVDLGAPDQCWERSKLEPMARQEPPCAQIMLEESTTRQLGEMSGPGPPTPPVGLLPPPTPLSPDAEAAFALRRKVFNMGLRADGLEPTSGGEQNDTEQVESRLGQEEQGLLHDQMLRDHDGKRQELSQEQEQKLGDCPRHGGQEEVQQQKQKQEEKNGKGLTMQEQDGQQLKCDVSYEGASSPAQPHHLDTLSAAVPVHPVSPGATGTCSSTGPETSTSSSRSRSDDFGVSWMEASAAQKVEAGDPVKCEEEKAERPPSRNAGAWTVAGTEAAAGHDALRPLALVAVHPPQCAHPIPETDYPSAEDDFACGVVHHHHHKQQEQLGGDVGAEKVCEVQRQIPEAPSQGWGHKAALGVEHVEGDGTLTAMGPSPTRSSSPTCHADASLDTEGAAAAAVIGQSGAAANSQAELCIGNVPTWDRGRGAMTEESVEITLDKDLQAGDHRSHDGELFGSAGREGGREDLSDIGGGTARMLLECVFELCELVPLEPRTLRHGWHANLPVLYMEPDRQPFVPLSALPPPPPPRSLSPPPQLQQQQQQVVASGPSPQDGGNGAGPTGRWRIGAHPVPFHAGLAAGNSRQAVITTADRCSSSGIDLGQPEDRPSDDKRALLRWLLSNSSVVQPLQAAGSLEEELQDEDFLAAAAAQAAEATAVAGFDGRRSLRRPHGQVTRTRRSQASRHNRSFSAADAAALLDPGPAPGFLPSALAVLFRQEWPRPTAGPLIAGLRTSGLEAPPTTRPGPGPGPGPGSGRGSPADRRVASTPSIAAVEESSTVDVGVASASTSAVGGSGSEAPGLSGGIAASRGLLLRRAGASAGDLTNMYVDEGDDRLSAAASPTSSTMSYVVAASAPLAPSLGFSGGSQTSLTSTEMPTAAGGVWRTTSPPLPPSVTFNGEVSGGHLLPPLASIPPRHSSSASQLTGAFGDLSGEGAHSGKKPMAGELRFNPSGGQRGGARDVAKRLPSTRRPGGSRDAIASKSHNPNHPHQTDHELQSHGASVSISASAPAVQRICELVEVRASIRKLMQLQERLTAVRAGALGMRRRLEEATERRHRLDEARARAEAARAEGREWASRAAFAEAQLRAMQATAAQRRRELLDRADALKTAAGVLQAAEQRRLNAEAQLAGPSGRGRLAALTAALVGRHNRLIAELGRVFQIGPVSEALLEPDPLDLTLDSSWAGEWGRLGSYGGMKRGYSGELPAEAASVPSPNRIQGGEQDRWERDPGQQQNLPRPLPVEGSAEAAAVPSTLASANNALRTGIGIAARSGPTRLAVMGLELPPDLIERSLQGTASWSPLGLGRRYDADQRTAAGLGYLAAMVDMAATYLSVPLRYPIAPRVSVSYISDPVPPSVSVRSGAAGPTAGAPLTVAQLPGGAGSAVAALASATSRSGGEWRLLNIATGSLTSTAAAVAAAATGGSGLPPPPAAVGLIPGPRGVGVGGRLAVFSALLNEQLEPRVAATPAGAVGDDAHPAGINPSAGLPLFWGDGARDRTRFAYAVYLLSKDVEQLLAAHGIPPLAPNQPLPNLYVLITAAASGVPRRADSSGSSGRCTGGPDGDGASGSCGDGDGMDESKGSSGPSASTSFPPV